LNTRPKELSTATPQMSAQPAVPQGYCYTYKFYALHTNHLPTFLKRIVANSVSGNSAHHSSISLVRQPPPSSTTPTHPHLIATFAPSTPPPIMPTTHHVGRPPPSHDDRRGNAMSPIEQPATSTRGNDDGNRVATSQSATWHPDNGQRRGQSPLPLTVC